MEGAWPAAPRAASRSPEPGGESAGRRRSAQLQIGPDGKLLRCAAAAETGEWSEGGSWERGGSRAWSREGRSGTQSE